ncbi:LADA_0F14620g1_1 [Lachancea dasiensis]|uniref:ATP-dependent RNA helicase n=1 Tax=Lachancea dasiensis TaxID=1072105 RepID=A0A1G4JNF9_9SACH|nr:LADA_0F14620g1_1 [Lachancea dasiensis]
MFAARFDPTRVQSSEQNERSKSSLKRVIPMKRAKEVADDSGDEDELNNGDSSELSDNGKENNSSDRDSDDSESDLGMREERLLGSQQDGGSIATIDGGTTNQVLSSTDKHSSVFSRFQKTLAIQDKLDAPDIMESADEKEVLEPFHELVPIPQPTVVKDTLMSEEVANSISKSAAWLHTQRVRYDNTMIKPFASYKAQLNEKLLSNITTKFSSSTFPIQTILLDTLLPRLNFAQSVNKKQFGRRVGDVLVNASTGSGKTLAYSIPVIQCLSTRTVNRLRCLVVVPTKILIHQVFETLVKLSQGTSLITGISKLENSLREEHKKFQLQEPDILIITPGRLVDHLQLGTFSLKNLKFLILDEADRLLNQSFQNWCSVIMNGLKKDRDEAPPMSVIKMVFSATLTTNTEKLHNLQLNRPTIFMMNSVKLYHLPKLLQEYNINIPTAKSFAKPLFLLRLICALKDTQTRALVFVRSNEASIRLSILLALMVKERAISAEDDIEILSINSNNTRGLNNKHIKQFASSSDSHIKPKVLVATDLMSRGIDIENVTHVINYDLPISSQQYVHRCGRTARAQTSGVAFNMLVGKGEQSFWQHNIDSDLSRDVDGCHAKLYSDLEPTSDILVIDDGTERAYRESLEQLKNGVRND